MALMVCNIALQTRPETYSYSGSVAPRALFVIKLSPLGKKMGQTAAPDSRQSSFQYLENGA
jgi:hypothetical protein